MLDKCICCFFKVLYAASPCSLNGYRMTWVLSDIGDYFLQYSVHFNLVFPAMSTSRDTFDEPSNSLTCHTSMDLR